MSELAEIEARLKAATPGPWETFAETEDRSFMAVCRPS